MNNQLSTINNQLIQAVEEADSSQGLIDTAKEEDRWEEDGWEEALREEKKPYRS